MLFRESVLFVPFFSGTITSEVYQDIITQFIALLEKSECDVVFQQDNVRMFVSASTMDFLRSFISAGLWPPRSSNLNPLDFYLWGALKDKVYKTAPATMDELRGRIIEEVENITSDTCKKVFFNLIKRCHICKEADGGQFQHV